MTGPLWQFAAAVVAGIISIAGSAFFSGMETGLYVVNKIRLELQAERGGRDARRLRGILHRPGNLLAVILVGNNLFNYTATFSMSLLVGLLGVGGGNGSRGEFWQSLATLGLTTGLLFVFGESVPKHLFQRLAERLTYRFSGLLRASSLLFNIVGLAPLVRGFAELIVRVTGSPRPVWSPLAREGLGAIVTEGQASGVLTHFQSLMADRVMRIGEVTLADVQIPLRDVVKAPQSASREHIMELIRHAGYSRIPLMDDPHHVGGILDVYEVLMSRRTGDGETGEEATGEPAERAQEPLVLGGDMSVTDALYRMRHARAAMAVVTAPRGDRHTGIVTIKDLVEEIVGELEEW